MKIALNNLPGARAVTLGFAVIAAAASLPAVSAEPQLAIPSTSAGIWKAIDGEVAQLSNVVHSGKLETVHKHAFSIRDLAAALPEKSAALPADKLAQVKAEEKFVATLAERLDATGDANDMAGTVANFEKLQRILKAMRSSYAQPGAAK